MSFLGAKAKALFSRDEYQPQSGNIFHEHLVLAIDRSALSGDAESSLADMLQTSVFEVVKTDKIQSLIDWGLMECKDNWHSITNLAARFLTHHCTPRCQRRTAKEDNIKSFM